MKYVITENCIICGTCWEICPTESIEEYDWYYRINPETCVECGACARVCPNAAIIKSKEQESPQKFHKNIKGQFMQLSGVVISGYFKKQQEGVEQAGDEPPDCFNSGSILNIGRRLI